ncbi:bacterioferritin [Thalassotalea mangrovi]|uniref:Bacterioferritin n=1 Tax=Thalassotalea mangrovi TaxID=2572245 RepID=A0A4U1B757_9GAMM|nr:bacterioferritin [Thalassotalea mangrovi]TKB46303.1 bacterioferritin [Thalassotalea mangrovi]
MKTSKELIQQLNNVLANELIAINQYFLHARMHKNWGFKGLNKADYKRSIRVMKNADDIIERILFLEGLPNLQHLGRLRIGEHCEEMIAANLSFEMDSLQTLKATIAFCEQHQDYVSRDMLEEILEYQEEQIDWLEAQQYLIDHAGLKNYLQQMMEEE